MKLLLKAALASRRHLLLLFLTLGSMFFLTIASNLEIFSLGVITRTGSDFFALFGHGKEPVTLSEVQKRWPEIAAQESAISQKPVTLSEVQDRWPEIAAEESAISQEMASRYLASKGQVSLVSHLSHFLESHFNLSEDLKKLALFLVIVALFKAAALFGMRYFTQLVSIRVSRDLRQRYFEHIQSLPMSFYQDQSIGALSSKVFGDASMIASAMNSLLINYIQTPIAAAATLIGCFFISWKLSLIIFVGFPLVLMPIIILAKKIKIIAKEMQRNQESFASVLIDFLAGILTVKVFAMEEFSLRKYRERNFEMAKLEEKSARYGMASRPILHTVSSLFFAAVILSGLYFFHMQPSDLLVFCGLLYIFYEPIKKFAEENNTIFRGVAAAERMDEVLQQRPTIVDSTEAVDFKEFRNEISFRHVYFRYREEWILKDLSFTVKRGEMVALVGPTGAGKSTIAQLLPRLYDVTSGEILIDGTPLPEFRIRTLRDQIAFVPQRPFLFLDTIYKNISFGRAYSREEVISAAKRAHADEFIVELPGGYDAVLSETGKNLSGGQQQRLAIARALVKRAPILILDEATSSLDAVSESKIKEAISELKGQVTQIIIAHRLSTVEDADRIIFLDKGEKVAEGSKDELLENCPPFKRMWELMQLGI